MTLRLFKTLYILHFLIGTALGRNDLPAHNADLWRYWEFLPVRHTANIVSPGEIMTHW